MQRCFVIQPFNTRFNKRYADIYEPAIKAAGLEPYRVDADPGVDIPIEAIESGIRDSAICLADITEDNPNVWYELGFASAARRITVMICSDERVTKKYPFDIQHRTVIPYKVESTQDFDTLRNAITVRLKAQLKKKNVLSSISSNDAVASVEGLTQSELAIVAAAAAYVTMPEDDIGVHTLKRDVENAGFTGVAFALGFRRLREKSFVEDTQSMDYNGEEYNGIRLSEEAWAWIDSNEDKFVLKNTSSEVSDEPPF